MKIHLSLIWIIILLLHCIPVAHAESLSEALNFTEVKGEKLSQEDPTIQWYQKRIFVPWMEEMVKKPVVIQSVEAVSGAVVKPKPVCDVMIGSCTSGKTRFTAYQSGMYFQFCFTRTAIVGPNEELESSVIRFANEFFRKPVKLTFIKDRLEARTSQFPISGWMNFVFVESDELTIRFTVWMLHDSTQDGIPLSMVVSSWFNEGVGMFERCSKSMLKSNNRYR